MDEEYRAITATLNAFYTFHKHQYERVVKPKSIKYKSLSEEDQRLLPWVPNLIRDLTECININQAFTQDLADTAAKDWGIPAVPSEWAQPSLGEYDKVRSTLLQVAREWSCDGAEEREQTYGRLLAKACDLVPEQHRGSTKVLVPGCGLGRLVYEFVKHGFWTQGNEVSYHMLLALGFLLNRVQMAHCHTIFPYIHKLSHTTRRLYQVRPVSVPDENPLSIFGETQLEIDRVLDLMSMAAGSFVDLYGPAGLAEGGLYSQDASAVEFRGQNHEMFDIVATCFFVDTAHNVIDYLKSIRHCLKPGGRWLNIGPLHWHFEGDLTLLVETKSSQPNDNPASDQPTMEGLELTRDELLELIEKVGFKITEHRAGIQATYSSDVRASSKFVYGCDFWVAEKL
ncbi:N2227-domain-containing protein [Metschnikowia bicuspidata var. bicuspidata NRRL YB-4993]|uniref:carnosine N-methyltransferase n=1 Tax=Metschnikowia bicuspidata var. bicuspidata NRRL YB-4993 TaxID=869754 RepID=A0A1A0H7L5_9ASCO|nr:N2227-domain-containing protein [Metschnikowia bicuspidata var. bicuspidata NRRL YB-4993]OBA19893.1 N2227-domain-containing protein [Metschnikowia bicuspidata var. bicuspidata NRRL YB-4993]